MSTDGAVSYPRLALTLIVVLLALRTLSGLHVHGAEVAPRWFSIPAGEGTDTLKVFAAQAQCEIMFPSEPVAGVKTNQVNGTFTSRDALERLIAGTGLVIVEEPKTGALMITRPAASVARLSKPSSIPNSLSEKSPPPVKRKNPFAVIGSFLALVISPAAKAADIGTIEGRVVAVSSGTFLERARLVAEPGAIETFTDSGGFYRLQSVPAGKVQVRVFYTGYSTATEELNLAAGQTLSRDYALKSAIRAPGEAEIVKLSDFYVTAERQMNGAALAINEQRYAPNIKTVVATDEYPKDPEGNVAELMKFLPGISVEYNGSNARWITMNGAPQDYVPISIDGFGLASTGGDTTRRVGLDFVSISNLSRVEVESSPTPEAQGAALAGSVNMVSKSSFERSKPGFDASVYFTMRDNARDLKKTPGPRDTPTYKIRPGFDFSLIVPVNKRFGFTLTGSKMQTFAGIENESGQTWRGTTAATTGTAFPNTTPDRPYMTTYYFQMGGKGSSRESIGASADLKLTDRDRVTVSGFYSYNDLDFLQHRLTFNITQVPVGGFGPSFTRGSPGQGNVQMTTSGYNRVNSTYMFTGVWRHAGPIWQADAGASFSRAYNLTSDVSEGLFQATTAQRTGLTIDFNDAAFLRPGSISVRDAAGAPVDVFGNLGAYALTSATAGQPRATDVQRNANANLKRSFGSLLPFSIKLGADVRQSKRDLSGATIPYTFVGADGRSSTTPIGSDDSAAPFVASSFSQLNPPQGWPNVQWTSPLPILSRFQSNPSQFTSNENTNYRNIVSNSKYAEETVSAAYLRGDLSLLERRLKLVGGVRAEQTNVSAAGPLTDPTRNIVRNAQGQPVLNAAGQTVPITTDPLAASRLTFLKRGAKVDKEYLRLFPSLNASYSLKENLIARASYYESIGRPNLNQYAGGITLPDTEQAPSGNNRITVNNAAIKAWSARTEKVRLEYYFEGVGQISIGGFRRDFKNFFGSTVFRPTDEFLSLYGLAANPYSNYDVATQYNISSTVRMTGLEFDYKQALIFLPPWARGVQIFANGTALRATGDASNNFFGYIPRTASWGVSLSRPKYMVRLNWSYRSARRTSQVAAGSSIDPATYTWDLSRINLDVGAEYQFAKHFLLYVAVRNATNKPNDTVTYGPLTPDYARFNHRGLYNALWTMGVKAKF